MFKHIVMWDLRADTPEEKARVTRFVKQQFEALRGQVPGLLRIEVGIDSSRVAYACDAVSYTHLTLPTILLV